LEFRKSRLRRVGCTTASENLHYGISTFSLKLARLLPFRTNNVWHRHGGLTQELTETRTLYLKLLTADTIGNAGIILKIIYYLLAYYTIRFTISFF